MSFGKVTRNSHLPRLFSLFKNMERIRVRGELRRQISLRDRGRCRHCKVKASRAEINKRGEIVFYDKLGKIFHIDHLKPVSEGGKNNLDNLVLSCVNCNTSVRRKLVYRNTEVGRLLKEINGKEKEA